MKNKKISVIGLGYIGLPTAALLASNGYEVAGMDINKHAVETINQGKVHIVEPNLDACVRSAVNSGRLKAFLELQRGDVYMICVPTPFYESGDIPAPNVEYVLSAARSIAKYVKPGDLVILESTSPVGTTEEIQNILINEGVEVGAVHIAYCPERVLPGKIMTELVENDRIIGGLTHEATEAVAVFYRTFIHGEVLRSDSRTAEMCKLTENSFRDVNIAFANELSLLCEKDGINVWELIRLANRHPRVDILQPGTGVGGHCIAVDPWFIVSRDQENARLIKAAREVNNYKTKWVVNQIEFAIKNKSAKLRGNPKVICMGLSFKPDIDDLRESPALEVVEELLLLGYDVEAIEPNIDSHTHVQLTTADEVDWTRSVCAVLVKHKEFTSKESKEFLRLVGALDFCGVLN